MIEKENAELRAHCEELMEVAKMLEDRAVELEEERGGAVVSVEEIKQMTIEELAAAETIHQEALNSIVQQKRILLEQMARKNGCSACGKTRSKSTVLFPCRHVVCSSCGESLKKCPDCKAAVEQRFELAD